MFEPLAVMKDEIIIVRRDYFGVDVWYACYTMCHVLLMTILREFRNGKYDEWTYCFIGVESRINHRRFPNPRLIVNAMSKAVPLMINKNYWPSLLPRLEN
jgi:hypothetical protein